MAKEPVRLGPELRKYQGLWVAIRDGKVVEARQTPYELVMVLMERGIDDASIVRSPRSEEPLRIGLG